MAKAEDKARVAMVTLRLPMDLVKRAKHVAVDEERTFTDVVAAALDLYLSRKGGAK